MRWVAWIMIFGCAYAQTDLSVPTSPSDYRSAFFGADFRGLDDTSYANWISPGNEFCRVWLARNCDGSSATEEQVSGALATWEAMSQCRRWRVRLHHQGLIWVHDSQPKIEIQYYTGIPVSAKDAIVSCLVADEFEYLGSKASVVCAALNARAPDLCSHFWPTETMTPVVYGWEADAE